MMGMLGEQHYGDNTVWITKTQALFGKQPKQVWSADKIINITRNPIDVFPSCASLFNTGSHTLEPENPWNTYTEFWDGFLKKFAPIFEIYHQLLLELSKTTPTFLTTYEDLRLDSQTATLQMFSFLLDTDITGRVIEARIKQVCSTDNTSKAVYKLKSNSTNLSRNRSLYNDEQIDYLKKTMPKALYFWGYTNVDPKSHTNFFQFEAHD